jgi:hypothetical protein
MSAIRSGPPLPALPPGLPPAGEAGRARQAQSAFFRAAMDQAAPPVRSQPAIAAAAPAPAPAQAPALRPLQTSQAAPEPTRLLRPGSLLDIRI